MAETPAALDGGLTPSANSRSPIKLVSQRQRAWRTFSRNRSALVGLVLIVLIVLVAIFAPLLSPFDPVEQSTINRLQEPSATHPLGRDDFGRDVLSRILYGTRVALTVGVLSVLLGGALGTTIGIVAGYFGGKIESVLMRLVDVLLSFPDLITGLLVMAVLGSGQVKLIIAIGLTVAPRFARIAYGPTLALKEKEFVEAARALGQRSRVILSRHILPNIGGELLFEECYSGNPLVNALCVGVMRHEDVHLAKAEGAGNKVILFGARTGGDGIGGVSVLASETFDAEGPAKRPAVQVGDPFTEKLLIEACLELFAQDLVTGIQDLGGAGLSCATSELASAGTGGMHVDLDTVPLRDSTLTPAEILMSESQERMMAIVTPADVARFLDICARWDVQATVIGEVTDSERMRILDFVSEEPFLVARVQPAPEEVRTRSRSRR